jgi:hypothetical protein
MAARFLLWFATAIKTSLFGARVKPYTDGPAMTAMQLAKGVRHG